ncbi:MAG: hypothetical protein RLZZ536_3095 [Planctomycetota bacterium]
MGLKCLIAEFGMLQAPIYSLRLILGNLRAYQNRDLPLTQKKFLLSPLC